MPQERLGLGRRRGHHQPGRPGASAPGQHLILAAVALLVLTAVWLFLLPWLMLAIRLLAQVTRRMVADWCGIRIADPYRPARTGQRGSSCGGSGGGWPTRRAGVSCGG